MIGHIWGSAFSILNRSKGSGVADLLLLAGLAGIIFGAVSFSHAAAGTFPIGSKPVIDLSPWALPKYTFFSLMRGVIAYVLSLGFTLVYGYWASKDKIAQRVLIPLLDILQSIPVLGFLPIVLLVFVNFFGPGKSIGIELAVIVMIFTGQAWNMTFSFFHSLNSIPMEQREAAAVYRFDWWEKFKWMELPSSMMGLVWNSMMSMAGGWFFLMAAEYFKAGEQVFGVPGIGSYMSVANEQNDWTAKIYAIIAMVLMIVVLDQFLWRPVVVWAQKFRVEEGGETDNASSWFLDLIRKSRLLSAMNRVARLRDLAAAAARKSPLPLLGRKVSMENLPDVNKPSLAGQIFSTTVFVVLVGGLLWGGWQLFILMRSVSWEDWKQILIAGLYTLLRVLAATALGTLWALPAGIAIGLSPRLSRVLQPVVQVVASFPAPMLYTIVLGVLWFFPLGFNSMILMLLGTQWYILFNVIAGAMAIPADLKEMSRSFGVSGWQRFWVLYVPACFPYLVTGWVTAAGGAWNASIISEYIDDKPGGSTLGLGSLITQSSASNYPKLAASVVVMSAIVVLFNRFVWRQCYQLAETRFSLSK